MSPVLDNLDLYGQGLLTTLRLCLAAGLGALVLGLVVAVFRVSPLLPLRAVGTAWVTVLRNTPLTVVLFFMAFGLPELGINGQYFWFGTAGLALYTSAFVCEAIRSGVNAVSPGQAEAARAIGLTFGQSLHLVVLPQALRAVVPPLGSVLIAMVKNSAIAGAFGIGGDLYSVGASLTSAQGYAALPVLTGVALGYLVITIPAGVVLGVLERKLHVTSVDSGGSGSVLYDAAGPRAKRRALVVSAVSAVVVAVLAVAVVLRLGSQGQLDASLWGPVVDPTDATFPDLWALLGRGIGRTLRAAAFAIVLSLVIGSLLAVVRVTSARWYRWLVVGLVELLRGVPVVVAIFFASRVLPQLGLRLDTAWYLVIGLTVYNSVVIAEIVRSGLAALPKGQSEAAMSIGLSRWQSLRLVLLPQAFRIMLPALISQLVVVLKDTSLGAFIGYQETVSTARVIIQNLGNPIPMYLTVAVLFVAANYALSRLAVLTERRLSRPRAAAAVEREQAVESGLGSA